MDGADLNRKLRLQMNNNNSLRRQVRNLTDTTNNADGFLKSLASTFQSIDLVPHMHTEPAQDFGGRGITIEHLFSDLQLGQLIMDYHSEVAARRVAAYLPVALVRIAHDH